MENKEIELEVISSEKYDEETLRAIKFYLADEFFDELKNYLETEDYNMAKDVVKGLYILAGEFKFFKLYQCLIDIYEDLMYDEYKSVIDHYEKMYVEYGRLKEVYCHD